MLIKANEAFENQNWIDAQHYYSELLEVNGTNYRYLEKRGYCNFKLRRNSQAISDFSLALSLTKSESQLYFFRGNVYLQSENYNQALDDFNMLIAMSSNHSAGINQRGLVYIRLEKRDEACKDFRKSLELGNQTAAINIDKYCK